MYAYNFLSKQTIINHDKFIYVVSYMILMSQCPVPNLQCKC